MELNAPHPWMEFDERFDESYTTALVKHLSQTEISEDPTSIRSQVREEASSLFQESIDRITDPQSQWHILMACYILASDRVLQRYTDSRSDIFTVVEESFSQFDRQAQKESVRESLENADDPMKTMVENSERKMQESYGDIFEIEAEGDGEQFYSSTVHQCGYHEFFESYGVPELTQVMCAWDRNWADEIDPDEHGIEFKRPTTIAAGDDACRFEFHRVDEPTDND